jgi:hypothetical protein
MAGPLVRCPGVQRAFDALERTDGVDGGIQCLGAFLLHHGDEIVLAADRVQGPHGGNLLQGAGERGLFLGICGDHHVRADAASLVVRRQAHRVAA